MARIYEFRSNVQPSHGDAAATAAPPQAYFEMARLVERMHRRFLDVLRVELNRLDVQDVAPAQAMIMLNMGEGELSVRDLMTRGYYLGSNASYNIKQLVDSGYVLRTTAPRDRRAVNLKLAPKGLDLVARLRATIATLAGTLAGDDADRHSFDSAHHLLRRMERQWSDFIEDQAPDLP